MSFLLESVEGGAVRGRYSIIGLEPDLIWRAFGDRAEINRTPRANAGRLQARDAADARLAAGAARRVAASTLPPDLPPMAAGVFGYMGYDTVRLIERLPNMPPDALGVPDAILVRPTVMVIFDAVKDEMTLVTPVYPQPGGRSPQTAYEAARRAARAVSSPASTRRCRTQRALSAIALARARARLQHDAGRVSGAWSSAPRSTSRAGDVFQIVLSQRFSAPFTLPPFALYRALRRTNPSPFLFHLDFGDFALVGSSPGDPGARARWRVTIRPLAGTRRRGATPEEDAALERELLADPKERAEHLMLLDLGRNDVGRVAKIGSVRVASQLRHRALQPGHASLVDRPSASSIRSTTRSTR